MIAALSVVDLGLLVVKARPDRVAGVLGRPVSEGVDLVANPVAIEQLVAREATGAGHVEKSLANGASRQLLCLRLISP